MRRVADRSGVALEREDFVFLKAAKTLSDTRLAPGEKRSEEFLFPTPPGNRVRVRANLVYVYSPMARIKEQQRVTFSVLSQLVE